VGETKCDCNEYYTRDGLAEHKEVATREIKRKIEE